MAQGSPSFCQHVLHCILHAVDRVFTPATPDTPNHKETVSEKKMLQGDGGWMQRKEILGWTIDSALGTLELTDCCKAWVLAIFAALWDRKRVGLKAWQRLLGELCFMAPAIPGSAGLFGTLQLGITYADRHHVHITSHLRDHLTDFEHLAQSVATHPTRLAELVPDYPSAIGSVDAAKSGMGGVLFTDYHPPLLWRVPFPLDLQSCIVSTEQPNGDIMNSNLEQAGVLAQADVANTVFDLRDRTLATLNDNIAAISHNKKGAITSDQSAAYICRLTSLHHHHHRYYHKVSHISGEANEMANTLSRHFNLTNDQILTLFNCRFPQAKPWRMCHLAPGMLSALTCLLLRKRPNAASFLQLNPTEPTSSHIGWLSAPPLATDPSWMMWPRTSTSTFSSSLAAATTMDSSTAACSPSDLNVWWKPYAPWDRNSPDWTSPILACTGHATSTDLEPSSAPGTMKTQPTPESGPSTSPSYGPSANTCTIMIVNRNFKVTGYQLP